MRSKDYQVFRIFSQFLFIALIQGHPVQGSARYDLKVKVSLQRFATKCLHQKPLVMQSFRKTQTTHVKFRV